MTTRPNEAIARNLEIELSSLYSQYHSREFDIHPREVEAEAIRLILDALKMTTNPTQDPKDSQKSRQRSHRNAPGHSSESLNHPLKRHFPVESGISGLNVHQLRERIGTLREEKGDREAFYTTHAEKLAEALRDLFRLIEIGVLVRDISHDADPKWYLKAIELTQVLKAAQTALADQKEAK